MKTKITLSFKIAQAPGSPPAPTHRSLYAECAVPLPTKPNCCTQSNSHCHFKLSLTTQVPSYKKRHFLQETFPGYTRKGNRVRVGTFISSCKPLGRSIHDTWSTSMQGERFSSWMHHSAYHTVAAQLTLAVRSFRPWRIITKKPRNPRSKGWCPFEDVQTEAERNLQLLKVIRTASLTFISFLFLTEKPPGSEGVLQERGG